ncbi:TetR/AcrR family transcriptional regulator [Rhizorhabdus argentea]|uniref:TetR/AcrR family transcriptional regulator n=1 Tax=Rhizorhabdus argentea TaxID=1387174 RepID=UPI0030ED13BA
MNTKEAMIVAAERRFALHGLEGVSLRQIALDAHQRNESAAHYHFGSREGLIRAILDYRISKINARRERWFSDEDPYKGVSKPRLIASALIYPMAEEIFADWRKCYWVRFMSQLFAIEKFRSLAEEMEPVSHAFIRAYDMLRSLPDIDPVILEVRREALRRDVVWGLAQIEALSFQEDREICELHVANLVDMIAAAIAVAPSSETLLKAGAVANRKVRPRRRA